MIKFLRILTKLVQYLSLGAVLMHFVALFVVFLIDRAEAATLSPIEYVETPVSAIKMFNAGFVTFGSYYLFTLCALSAILFCFSLFNSVSSSKELLSDEDRKIYSMGMLWGMIGGVIAVVSMTFLYYIFRV